MPSKWHLVLGCCRCIFGGTPPLSVNTCATLRQSTSTRRRAGLRAPRRASGSSSVCHERSTLCACRISSTSQPSNSRGSPPCCACTAPAPEALCWKSSIHAMRPSTHCSAGSSTCSQEKVLRVWAPWLKMQFLFCFVQPLQFRPFGHGWFQPHQKASFYDGSWQGALAHLRTRGGR